MRGTGMTQANAELLIEIGAEEIPAWMLEPAAGQFAQDLVEMLQTERLSCRIGAMPRLLHHSTDTRTSRNPYPPTPVSAQGQSRI